MISSSLLAELGRRGIHLRRKNDDLVIHGDRDALDPSLVSQLRLHKASLLQLVRNSYDEIYFPAVITPDQLSLVTLTQEEIDLIVEKVPGGAGNVQDIYPLAPLQEGILFHHMLAGDGDTYLLPSLIAFATRQHLDRFLEAVQAVIARHDILRTAIVWDGLQEPVQVVWSQAQLPVEEVTLAESDAAAQMRERFDGRRYRLNVTRAPLMEAKVAWDEAQNRWLAMLLIHHLAVDHEALGILFDETCAHLACEQQQLPEPQPFRNFIARTRMGISAAEHEAFFREMLACVEEPTLPFGMVNVQGDGASIVEVREALDRTLARSIRERARSMGVSASSVFHLAWALVLSRVSAQENVVFGTLLLGRMQGGVETGRVLGLFVNTLPICIRIGEQSVQQALRQTHGLLSQLLRHEHASLVLAQRCSAISAPTPLFSSLLNYRHGGMAEGKDKSADLSGMELLFTEVRNNYPLTMSVDDLGNDFALTVLVDAAHDPRRICELMRTALTQLVDALGLAPHTPVRAIDVLPIAERRLLLETFNATEAPYPRDALIHELFEVQAVKDPQAIAVVYADQKLTYEELNRSANQLAHFLRSQGMGPGQLVALCIERSVDMLTGMLGILKAGGAYVPLDPSYPGQRLEDILRESQAGMILTQRKFAASLPSTNARVVALDDQREAIAQSAVSNLDTGLRSSGRSSQLAYVIFTSGSTGKPKGVMVEHRNIVNYAVYAVRRFDIENGSGGLLASSASFDLMLTGLYPPLICGRAVLICPEAKDMSSLAKLMLESSNLAPVKLTPSHLAIVQQTMPNERLRSRVRTLVLGGEPLMAESLQAWRDYAPDTRIYNHYGPTEATVGCIVHEIVEQSTGPVPIGRPISNVQIYVLDAHLRPAPIGAAGEIYIGGAGVARGYLNRPDLTAERFMRDPFAAAADARMYKTGDLGRFAPNGDIEYLGRNDQQVKIRGFRIELGEIEAQLRRQPSIREAAVLAREDVSGDKRLVAYIVIDEAMEFSINESRALLTTTLPDYMVPNAYVVLDRLPLTPNGKLDKKALPPPEDKAYVARQYAAPEGQVEEILAGIWREVLRVERIGRHDNFFELGGHSLLALQLVAKLRKTGLSVEVGDVFNNDSLSALARALESKCGLETRSQPEFKAPANLIPKDCEAIVPAMLSMVDLDQEQIDRIARLVPGGAANIQDIYPLAPLQEGILFHHMLQEATDTYVKVVLLELESRERLQALTRALQAIVDRHDVFRTAVLWKGLTHPLQVVYRHADMPVEEIELDPTREIVEQLKERISSGRFWMDLQVAPLMRLGVACQPGESRLYVLLQQHHIVNDHVSSELVLSEAQAHLSGNAQYLSEPVAYREYVAQALAKFRQDEATAFFSRMLGTIDEPTAPFELLNVYGDGSEIIEASRTVDDALAQRLRKTARRLGVSSATLFHVAWALVVAHASGRDDVVFGTILSGRLQGTQGAERIMGMFINTLPLRVSLDGCAAEQAVKQTHRDIIELLKHEQAHLALAQRCSGIAGTAPLFSAVLNYRHSIPMPGPGGNEGASSSEHGIRVLAVQQWSNYPLMLSVDDFGEGFEISVQAERRIDPRQVTGYMYTALQSLLWALENAAEKPLLQLSILPSSERERLINGFNATAAVCCQDKLIHELFEAQAEKNPQAIAVVYEARQLSYGQLNEKANQLAHYLRGRGVRPNQLVAICVERSLEMVVGLLGILKAGAAYVPLDPSYPRERLNYMIDDAAPRVIVTQSSLEALLPKTSADVIRLDREWADIAKRADGNLPPSELGLTASNLAYVIYTSGSTGRPKGVMVEHGNVNRLFSSTESWFHFDERDVWTLFHSFAFDFAVWELWGALLHGGRLVVVPFNATRSPDEFYELLCAKSVTILNQTPSAFRQLIAAQAQSKRPHALRRVIFGGEALEVGMLKPWYERNAADRPLLVNMYGITETTVHVTYQGLEPEIEHAKGSSPIGVPIPDLRIYILNRHREPVPVGVVGEIYVGGAGVARGYLNRPDLTAERFLPDPFAADAAARMYKSGDLGRWRSDGNIEFFGRNDAQVKIRGYRIELGEIESQLTKQAQVEEAVVIAREDLPGEKRLVAYVVYKEAAPNIEELRTHLKTTLPEYMLPSAFVQLQALPLTANGKLDRKALPPPDVDAYSTRLYEAPQGETEDSLADVWREILQVERISRHDGFFELGGHSLLATRLVNAIKQRFDVDLPLRIVFERSSLADLAKTVADRQVKKGADANLEMLAILEKIKLIKNSGAKDTVDALKEAGGQT